MAGGVAEWFKAAVSKTVVRLWAYRGFESHPLRQAVRKLEVGGWKPDAAPAPISNFQPPTSRQYGGGVPEWTNGHAWRACVPFGYRGFESHPLRHADRKLEVGGWRPYAAPAPTSNFQPPTSRQNPLQRYSSRRWGDRSCFVSPVSRLARPAPSRSASWRALRTAKSLWQLFISTCTSRASSARRPTRGSHSSSSSSRYR